MRLPTYTHVKERTLRNIARLLSVFADLPFVFRKHVIPEPRLVSHTKWADYLAGQFNKKGMKVLEIGSRNVTGANLRHRFSNAAYVGFDFYPGENVDVVGDAHQLSSYFSDGEKFDLIFSAAVFEHLYMPWVAAEEIARMLNVGGFVFIESHFSYHSHERPWNFFQFSDMGLRVLFNSGLGFELVDKGLSNPMGGHFSSRADRHLRYRAIPELYCHSEILCKKVSEAPGFDWKKLTVDEVVDGTRYPLPANLIE